VVKHDSVVEKSQLGIWKVQVVAGFLREFFPVADRVVRDVADGASNKSKFAIGDGLAFNEFFKDVQRVAGFLSVYFSGFLVADFRVSILYFNSQPRVEAYERVLRQFPWAFDGFEEVGCFITLMKFREDFKG